MRCRHAGLISHSVLGKVESGSADYADIRDLIGELSKTILAIHGRSGIPGAQKLEHEYSLAAQLDPAWATEVSRDRDVRATDTWHREGVGANSAERGSMRERVLLQLRSAKQLSVGGYDDGGQAHRDRPHIHREIESPVDEKASSDRNSDNIVGRRPN